MLAADNEGATTSLDAYLGFAPWREAGSLRYELAVREGWISSLPDWDLQAEAMRPLARPVEEANRRDEALRLEEAGRTPEEIAQYCNTDVETVEGLIEQSRVIKARHSRAS